MMFFVHKVTEFYARRQHSPVRRSAGEDPLEGVLRDPQLRRTNPMPRTKHQISRDSRMQERRWAVGQINWVWAVCDSLGQQQTFAACRPSSPSPFWSDGFGTKPSLVGSSSRSVAHLGTLDSHTQLLHTAPLRSASHRPATLLFRSHTTHPHTPHHMSDPRSFLPLSAPNSNDKPSTPRRKRPLAKRSCTSCREKKARCELPDVSVPSSRDPVPEPKRCHRCKVLDIDCVVWDGDRKRKPRPPPHSDKEALPAHTDSSGKESHPSSSWSPLSHLAHAAEVIGASTASSPPTSSTTSSSATPLSFLVQDYRQRSTGPSSSTSQSDLLFKPPSDFFARLASRANTPSSPCPDDHSSEQGSCSPTLTVASSAGNGTSSHGYPTGASALPNVDTSSMQEWHNGNTLGPDKEGVSKQKAPPRTWRSIWRTPAVLVDYAAQQPQFTRYLLTRIDSPSCGLEPTNIVDMIDRQSCLDLKPW